MIIDGREVDVFLAGLTDQPTINKPVLTEGTAVRDGGIVFERSLAHAFHLPVGTAITFKTASGLATLATVGTAVIPSQSRFPRQTPGLAWVSRSDLQGIVPDQSRWRWTQSVQLKDPMAAPRVAETAALEFPPGEVSIETWQDQRENALRDADPIRIILSMYTLLFLIVSYALISILIGARVAGQYREIALLRAIGLTPRQVSAVFATESFLLGFIGVVFGFIPGAILTPRLAETASVSLLSSPTVQANLAHILDASILILPIVVFSAYTSARRSSRASVVQSIQSGTAIPAQKSRLGRFAAIPGLPIPMEVGLKDILARRSRALWLMFAIAITVTAMVVTLSVKAALDDQPSGKPSDVPTELPALVYTLDALLTLITISAFAGIALLSVRERIRDFGILKVIGLTPSQITTSLVGSHTLMALVSSAFAIPIGLLLYLMLYLSASGESGTLNAPVWWLAAVPMVVSIATAIVTGIPALVGARIPASTLVRYE
jgi:putative ABC transport system permease protein